MAQILHHCSSSALRFSAEISNSNFSSPRSHFSPSEIPFLAYSRFPERPLSFAHRNQQPTHHRRRLFSVLPFQYSSFFSHMLLLQPPIPTPAASLAADCAIQTEVLLLCGPSPILRPGKCLIHPRRTLLLLIIKVIILFELLLMGRSRGQVRPNLLNGPFQAPLVAKIAVPDRTRHESKAKQNTLSEENRDRLESEVNRDSVAHNRTSREKNKPATSKKESGEMSSGKIVCVTGASGYIASWLVKLLLLRGYTVNASVRDPNDPKKTQHLLSLDGAEERLKLFKADLLEEGSFDPVVEECEGVFHTASPFYHDVTDPKVELLDPAVKGTLNVLNSCTKSPFVKRVVLTSSIAAVVYNGKPRTPDVVVDETWFSDPDVCKDSKLWYVLSKTLAEDAAWKFAKEKGIDMVAINPAMVIGPLLQPTLNTSAAAILSLIKGAHTFPNASFGWINVKDVANAHIQALEIPSASGRYCLVERVAHYSEVVKILRDLYPAFQLPEKCADDKPYVPTYQVSKEKATTLGIEFTPLEVSIKETVESLKEKGFVDF